MALYKIKTTRKFTYLVRICTYQGIAMHACVKECDVTDTRSCIRVVLSGTSSQKSVQFFKLVLRYDYSIVLYMLLACTMQYYYMWVYLNCHLFA